MDIEFTFINKSGVPNADVAFFQKNLAVSIHDYPVAWKVIKNSKPGESHPFIFPVENELSAIDSWNKETPLQTCANGQLWYIKWAGADVELKLQGNEPVSWREVTVLNLAINPFATVKLYKNKRLLAVRTRLISSDKAKFEMRPVLSVAVLDGAEEGAPIIGALPKTDIALTGITKANIVLTGKGPGTNEPFKFTLERTA